MSATRKPGLTVEQAPFEVLIPMPGVSRRQKWKTAQDHMFWLIDPENNTAGHYTNRYNDAEDAIYNFTDPNTATFFKMFFG